MRLGLVSAILADSSLEEVVDFSSKAGFESIEVCCWPKGKADRRYSGVTHIDADAVNEKEMDKIKKLFKDKNMNISSLAYYPNPLDEDKKKRDVYIEHLFKLIDLSNKLDVNRITTFIGKDKNKTVEDNLEMFEVIWEPIIKYAQRKNVEIGIENCQMYFTKDEWPGGNNLASTPAIWRKMFEIFNEECFGLNYDPSHPYWMQMDYIKPIYEFKDRIKHVHVKDAIIDYEAIKELGIYAYPLQIHTPKLPGLGKIDWERFFLALNDIGYTKDVAIEIEDKSFENSIDDIKKAIKQSYKYIRKFV